MIEEMTRVLKKKVDSYEIYQAMENELSMEEDHGHVSHVCEGTTLGVGLKVLIGNRLGAAYTYNPKDINKVISTAIAIAKVSKLDKNHIFAVPGEYSKATKPNKAVLNTDAEKASKFMKSANRIIKSVDNKMRIASGMFSKSHIAVRIVNSEGLDVEDEVAYNSYSAEIVFKDHNKMDSTSFTMAEQLPLKVTNAKYHALRLKSMLNKGNVKTKTMQVLLMPDALASFLNQVYSTAISARNIQEGKSIIKKGQKVLDKSVTIVDDAISKGLFCTSRFDDEGTPTKSFEVIKKGVFKQPLYDLYSANKENAKPTGNCTRSLLSSTSVSPNNIIFLPGTKSNLVGEIDEGLIVHNVLGEHTMDNTTGDFSLGVLEGQYVKKGKVTHAVKDTMIAGNFFRMLSNIDTISKGQEHVISGSGGMYLPKVLCGGVRVIGQG